MPALLNRIRNTTDGLLVFSETLQAYFFNLIKVGQKDSADPHKASSEVSRDLEYFLKANMTKREFDGLLVLDKSRDVIFLQKKLSDCTADVKSGPHRDRALAKAFEASIKERQPSLRILRSMLLQ